MTYSHRFYFLPHRAPQASGLAASRRYADVLWTFNDHGEKVARVFAVDGVTGAKLATYELEGADNDDWEDIAIHTGGDGVDRLYVADTGNNHWDKEVLTIYRCSSAVPPGRWTLDTLSFIDFPSRSLQRMRPRRRLVQPG